MIETAEEASAEIEVTVVVAEVSVATEVEAETAEEALAAEAEEMVEDLRCMMLFALSVTKNVKFHLDQQETNRFYAEIVSAVKKEIQNQNSTQEKDQHKILHKEFLKHNSKNLTLR
jgi:hypothetical protein